MLLPYEHEITPETIETLVGFWKSVLDITKKVVKDTSRPLSERWDIYLKVQPYLETDSVYWSPGSIEEEISWYDDFYLEKGETMQLDEDFMEQLEEVIKKNGWTVCIDAVKEEILASGYGAFENDW